MATEIVRKCETHLIETSFAKFRVRMVRMYVERQGRSQYEVTEALVSIICFLSVVFVFEGRKYSTTKYLLKEFNHGHCLFHNLFLATALK